MTRTFTAGMGLVLQDRRVVLLKPRPGHTIMLLGTALAAMASQIASSTAARSALAALVFLESGAEPEANIYERSL